MTKTVPARSDSDPTTRSRLLSAAAELMAEVGFAGVTTRAISERAGVNNALVHYHFGSKTTLLVEAAVTSLHGAFTQPIRILEDAPTVSAGVADIVRWLGELDVHDPGMRVLVELTIEAFGNRRVQPLVAAVLAEGRRELASALIEHFEVEADTAEGLAGALTALFDGIVLHRLVDHDLDLTPWAAALDACVAVPTTRRRGRRP